MTDEGYIRIGELSRRVGVNPELLRAWERRYGLLQPSRSQGGFRLYSDSDVARLLAMKEHLARGLSAAEAARLALAGAEPETPTPEAGVDTHLLESGSRELQRALISFDEPGAHAALDRLLASFGLDTVLREAILPLLRELGAGWARGETSVGQEHFASTVLRGRLLALARGWGRGSGPRAVLAAPPRELHDLGLVVFGLALHERGWRITFLGADTPIENVLETARRIAPDLVVLATLLPSRIGSVMAGLQELAAEWRVGLGGAGVTRELAEQAGAEHISEGPVEAADLLATLRSTRASSRDTMEP